MIGRASRAAYSGAMIELTRTVRFGVGLAADADEAPASGYAGAPPIAGLGALHELDVTVRGEPDPTTGYLLDIKAIDRAVRSTVASTVREAFVSRPATEPATLLPSLAGPLTDALPVPLASIRWRLSPFQEVAMSTDAPSMVSIRQKFEFAASHRLHVPSLSEERNRELFGKCNNPSGHGHNYVVEPSVEMPAGSSFSHRDLERLTSSTILDRFDHKHLNVDCEEFGEGRLNPSVENIARVCYDLLAPQVESAGARLARVTVWETDRTCAAYPASG